MPITIDGLDGYEALATARHESTGERMLVYQVVILGTSGYYRMVGRAQEGEPGNVAAVSEDSRNVSRQTLSEHAHKPRPTGSV